MRKNVFTQLSCFVLMACLPLTVSAASPQTGATAPLLPLVIGLMAAAVAAIIACLFLFKKKK